MLMCVRPLNEYLPGYRDVGEGGRCTTETRRRGDAERGGSCQASGVSIQPEVRGRSPGFWRRSPEPRRRSAAFWRRSPEFPGRSGDAPGRFLEVRGRAPEVRGSSPESRGRFPEPRRRLATFRRSAGNPRTDGGVPRPSPEAAAQPAGPAGGVLLSNCGRSPPNGGALLKSRGTPSVSPAPLDGGVRFRKRRQCLCVRRR
jgi:hypothetical protein